MTKDELEFFLEDSLGSIEFDTEEKMNALRDFAIKNNWIPYEIQQLDGYNLALVENDTTNTTYLVFLPLTNA